MTKYKDLREVAEAVFDGRVLYLAHAAVGHNKYRRLASFANSTGDFVPVCRDADHRMWLCLFVWEAMK
jgi:hypothetical protein